MTHNQRVKEIIDFVAWKPILECDLVECVTDGGRQWHQISNQDRVKILKLSRDVNHAMEQQMIAIKELIRISLQ